MRTLTLVFATALAVLAVLAVCLMDPASAATKRSTGSQNAIRIEALIPPLPLVRACRTAAAVRKFRSLSTTTNRASALEPTMSFGNHTEKVARSTCIANHGHLVISAFMEANCSAIRAHVRDGAGFCTTGS